MATQLPGISESAIPQEVRKWNWGAFFLTWIWGIGNNVLIAFLCFVPFLGFVMPIVLGIKGGEWAWQKKRWDNLEHFQRVQRIWAWVGLGVFLWLMATLVGALLFLFSMFTKTEPYVQGLKMASHSPAVIERIGEPITPGWLVSGAISINSFDGKANISFPIYGPNGSAVVFVKAVEDNGHWRLIHVLVEIDDTQEQINLLTSHMGEST